MSLAPFSTFLSLMPTRYFASVPSSGVITGSSVTGAAAVTVSAACGASGAAAVSLPPHPDKTPSMPRIAIKVVTVLFFILMPQGQCPLQTVLPAPSFL